MEKELNYKLTGENTELVKGESSQKAIENQSPKGSVVNTITVEEVKEFDKKADSKQDIDISEIKASIQALQTELASKVSKHEFDESTILTDEILAKVKSGDIVKVLQMEFIVNNKVNQSPRAITGSIVGAALENSLTILKLDWVKGEALEPVSVVYRFSEAESEE